MKWQIYYFFNFDISNQLSNIRMLRYEDTGKYDWHLDIGNEETSVRKITAIVNYQTKMIMRVETLSSV